MAHEQDRPLLRPALPVKQHLIHNIDRNEYQLGREFELGRMRIVASADLLLSLIHI